MKRIRLAFPLLLVLLTSCLSAGGEIRQQEFEAIDIASWPTPASSPTAIPTAAIPKVVLPTATPVVEATPAIADTQAEQAPVFGDFNLRDLAEEFPIVGVAAVKIERSTVRRGPGSAYGPSGTLEQGELAGIYGRDASGGWIYVQTLSRVFGWIPYTDVYALDTLADAPILGPDPLTDILTELGLPREFAQAVVAASAGGEPSSTGGGSSPVVNASTTGTAENSSTSATLNKDGLKSVTTAQVTTAVLPVRQRPGANFTQLATLSQGDELSILALNRDREWALILTEDQTFGWVSKDFLDIAGSLDNAPQVITTTPENDEEAAPFVIASNGGGVTAASTTSSGATIPVGGVNLPSNTLAVKSGATAKGEVEVKRGPDPSYATIDELVLEQPVNVRGINAQGDWLVVRVPDSGAVGWVPVDSLEVTESLAGATPVLNGWINNNGLKLRNGPGTIYETIGPLAIYDMVSILAVNERRDWIFIETLSGGKGWLPRFQLEIVGSLDGVPEVPATVLAVAGGNPGLSGAGGPALPLSGKLVFQESSGGDIMLINSDGTGLRRLTNGIDPVLSPDGQQVAFTRWQNNVGSLWTINIDGSNERFVLGEMPKAKGPDWSPDGSRIVLNFQHGGRPDIVEKCQDADEKLPYGAYNVTFKPGLEPTICFALLPDPFWTLRVIDLADGTFVEEDGGTYAFRPSWNPAQPWQIVSDGGQGLVVVDIDQNRGVKISESAGDGSPVYSPDGRFLLITAGAPGGSKGHEIFRLNADGSGRVRLTDTPFWVPLQPETEGVQWNNVAPTWSPDGNQIAFLTDRNGDWEIWVMGSDGSNQRPMFPNGALADIDFQYDWVDERVISWR